MFDWLAKLFRATKSRDVGSAQRLRVRSRYDAAATNQDNSRHWANADYLSPNAANSADIRRTLRARARYEVANNSYAKGIVLTLANDVIGTGPRLQMLTPDEYGNGRIERAWAQWAKRVRLAEKLRILCMAENQDGEGFAMMTTNPRLSMDIQLDLRLIEADQIATPNADFQFDSAVVDGIEFDLYGNATKYHVLREHPGDGGMFGPDQEFDRVDAKDMLHLFRADRPGQARGVPNITPAIPLFAQLRRYTLAVIAAAETAADFAAFLESEAPPDGVEPTQPFESLEIEQRMMTTLPNGSKMSQLRAEQPATTYEMFKHEIIKEIARCLNMPFNVAAGDSSAYNYASGRMDHQVYFKSIRVDRSKIETAILDRILVAWFDEAAKIDGFLPSGIIGDWPYQWFWDGTEHVDPVKEANAQTIRLANLTTTLAAECSREGRDWEEVLRQRAKEKALEKELGLATEIKPPTGQLPEDDEEETDDEQEMEEEQEAVAVGD